MQSIPLLWSAEPGGLPAKEKVVNTGGEELLSVANFLVRKKCFGMFKAEPTLAGMAA